MSMRTVESVTQDLSGLWQSALDLTDEEMREADTHTFRGVGGHSVAAATLLAAINHHFGISLSLATILRGDPSIADLASTIVTACGSSPTATVAAADTSAAVALPGSLRGVWLWHRLHPDSAAYNVVRSLRVDGMVHPTVLRAALGDVAARHEALRARVDDDGQGPRWIVDEHLPDLPITVQLIEHTGCEHRGRPLSDGGPLMEALAAIADQPLPMAAAPLWRLGLVYEPTQHQSWLLVVMHHLIADMRAADLVWADLADAYAQRLAGAPQAQFSDPAPSLIAMARREGDAAPDPALLESWRETLTEAEPAAPFPLPTRARSDSWHATVATCTLGPEESARLSDGLRSHSLSLPLTLVTVGAAVVARWHGAHKPQVVGLPTQDIAHPDDERVVGFRLQTVLVPVAARGGSFLACYREVEHRFLEAVGPQRLGYDHMLEHLRPAAQGTQRSPWIRLWVNDLTRARPPQRFGPHRAGEEVIPPLWALFDMNLYVWRTEAGFQFHLAIPEGTGAVSDLSQLLQQIVDQTCAVVADPEAAERGCDSPQPRPLLPAAVTPQPPTTAALVAQHAQRSPRRPAIVDDAGTMTYAELAAAITQRATELASCTQTLLCTTGGRDDIVTLLAAGLAGCRVVLVNGAWPQARIARAATLAARAEFAGRTHVLFTSGTTGDPLGVLISTATTDAAVDDLATAMGVSEHDRVAQLSSPSHDPALREIGLALRHGATLVVPPTRVRSNAALAGGWIKDEQITVLNWTPAAVALALTSAPRWDQLRWIVLAGGAPAISLVHQLGDHAPAARVINGYGCTETPQLVCWHQWDSTNAATTQSVPIGQPLPGRTVQVRADGRVCQAGEVGEVWVAAPHIADGYLSPGAPARFVNDSEGHRWFATGDRARMDATGLLHLAGRIDRQVAVHGQRVSLDDIEAIAASHPAVTVAVASVANDQAGSALVQLWAQSSSVDSHRLRHFLAEHLPAESVPHRIFIVDQLELSANFKPQPPEAACRADNATQQAGLHELVRDAEELLGTAIDPDANFFDAGFTSLSLLQLVDLVNTKRGAALDALAPFQFPTLSSLAAHLAEGELPPATHDRTVSTDHQPASSRRARRQEARRRARRST